MQLILTQGLPASGKSTWALAQPGFVVVNKDDIRTELRDTCMACGGTAAEHPREECEGFDPWVWSDAREKDVETIRDIRIEDALKNGYSVISSDTNLARKHKVRLEALARKYGAEYKVQRFDVPIEECLRRNAERTGHDHVPDDAIWTMYRRYVENDPGHYPLSAAKLPEKLERVVPDTRLPKAIISDLDGTLSLFKEKGHRGPYDASKCADDELDLVVRRVLETFYRFMGYQVIYLSGREDKYRAETEEFLRRNGCPPGSLYMRKAGDVRKDWIVKYELFNAHVRGKYDIDFVLDDRNQVVKMWREIGLKVFQVADGDF